MTKLLFLLVTLAASTVYIDGAPRVSLQQSLAKKLYHNEDLTANIFLTMADTEDLLNRVASTEFNTRGARLNAVAESLRNHAAESQKEVLDFLNKNSISYESFWVSNEILIRDASKALIIQLLHFESIKEIAEEVIFQLDEPIFEEDDENASVAAVQWGVSKIQADRVWATGNRGEGIVVGGIDSGVRKNHESLRGNFLGTYGWYDPGRVNANASPSDNNGHGTHTMATIVGSNGIGVAPNAKWMACRGCTSSTCPQGYLTACGEFMTCPTLTDKTRPDCTKAPHVVSNSWGGGQGTTVYNRIINAWRAGGIIPVFAQGNSGPTCGTANSPGDNLNVIGVGSTTSSDGLSSFSSVGPTKVGRNIKPDISAPGSNVYSAYHTSDTAYKTMSGTSMACPHTAGAVALITSAKRGQATFAEVTQALYSGAETNVVKTGKNCGGVNESKFPNNAFGHGRVDVNRAVLNLSKYM